MGTIRRRTSEDIRQRALETAARKQQEGCESCAASYLDLAREHGATETEITRAMGLATEANGGLGRRRLLQVTASALAAGAAGALLLPGRASARSSLTPFASDSRASSVPGFFGVDSCTSPERGRVSGMPLEYYVGELGATQHNAACFDENTAAFVTPAFTHGYWGVCGPNEGDSDPTTYGRQQAEAAIEAWNSNVNLGGRTIFADVESGFGGWGAPATKDDNVALVNAFISRIAEEGFIPGIYINNSDKANWFPSRLQAVRPVCLLGRGREAGWLDVRAVQGGMRYPRRHGGRLEGRYPEPLIRRHGVGGVAVLAEWDGLRWRLQLLAAERLLEVHAGDGGGAAGRDQGRDADTWRDRHAITHGHNPRP